MSVQNLVLFDNFVKNFPLPAPPDTTGTIAVEVHVKAEDPQTPSHVTMSGTGPGTPTEWIASDSTLLLTPTALPAHYLLNFQLSQAAPSSEFTLVGIQVYRTTLLEESSLHATLFLPAVSNQVGIHLLHDIDSLGAKVFYQLFIGVQNTSTQQIFWPDPTIEFDPQAGPLLIDGDEEES